ncbi:MAG: hypothetical protein B0A82_02830 [Alkalinema sp. CACIAM 70d]|nr:MAG: hypothetical protein B0A82_02830 [Alkalinema sp. CACIAM 70d]
MNMLRSQPFPRRYSGESIAQWAPEIPLIRTAPHPDCTVCVIVPVRNEAALLTQTLQALASQENLDGTPLAKACYEVIVLANNCSDRSAEIGRQFAAENPSFALHIVEMTLPAEIANVGLVRRLMMNEACDRLYSLDRPRGIIASTDGDSQASSTWIAAILHEMDQGADAVGGRIMTQPADRTAMNDYARACHLREVGYRYLIAELESYLDPDPYDGLPRHYQHYGASLAVTAQMYKAVGGMPPIPISEDVAFYRALLKANARFRHSPHVKVLTSARPRGRAAQGLADQILKWTEMGKTKLPFLVESAGAISTALKARCQLRGLWSQYEQGQEVAWREVAAVARMLCISGQWLVQEIAQASTFWSLFEQIEQRQQQEGIWQLHWPLTSIEQSIEELRQLVALHRRMPKSTVPAIANDLESFKPIAILFDR